MKLMFPQSAIESLSSEYVAALNRRDRQLTDTIEQEVFPSFRAKGFLTKSEFVTVCYWKTPRTRSRAQSNDEGFIREISSLAFTTQSEQLRIESWTLLTGVQWPTASVFLHFAFENQYPILDFRALQALGRIVPKPYTFPFWWDYTMACRGIAGEAGVSLRVLDQAMWRWSKVNGQ